MDDAEQTARIARAMVIGKIANCRTALLRAARERAEDQPAAAIREAAQCMAGTLQRLSGSLPLDTARGCEGEAAAAYFAVFDHLILAQREHFTFKKRLRRPPLDPVNALLSFLYTLLMHDVAGTVEAVGLYPAVGFLHRDRPGRLGLALDLMEELGPILADRLALSLINRRQIDGAKFRTQESGAVWMDDDTRKEVLLAYQTRKQETITHPFINEEIQLGLVPHVQALLLARHIRGDLDEMLLRSELFQVGTTKQVAARGHRHHSDNLPWRQGQTMPTTTFASRPGRCLAMRTDVTRY